MSSDMVEVQLRLAHGTWCFMLTESDLKLLELHWVLGGEDVVVEIEEGEEQPGAPVAAQSQRVRTSSTRIVLRGHEGGAIT